MKSITLISILIFTEVVCCSRWSVKMPWSLSAVNGSCAEIPCTFDYPTYGRNPWGMWLKGGPDPGTPGATIIYDSRDADNIHYNYRGRTEFSSDFTKKQCSLRIKEIRKSDEGKYYFRVAIINARNFTENYSYKSHVNLSIYDKRWISVSGELIAGKSTLFTCSVTHSCPSTDLQLMWIHDKVRIPFLPEINTSKENVNSFEGSQMVSSTFNFSPSADHHGKKLGCKLIVDGATAALQESLTLDVKLTVEGSSLLLYCMAWGSIPGNLTLVRNGAEISRSSTGELTQLFHNISSDDNGEYWCVAGNNLGTANSFTQISVQYQPTIVPGPTCTSSESEVHCTCSVRANPPANITWSVNGRIITGKRSDSKIFSSALNRHLVQSSLTLTHPTATGYLISCIGANEHGVSVGKYQLQSGDVLESSWIIVMPIRAAAAVLILIAIIVLVTVESGSHRAKTSTEILVSDELHPTNQRKVSRFGGQSLKA